MSAPQLAVRSGEAVPRCTDALYWNDFPEVRAHLNYLVTGHSTTDWMTLLGHYRPADRLLSLSCGNGWVERELHARGFARSIIGVDVNQALLDEARHIARRRGIAAEYRTADLNTASFAGFGFDNVLNYAALHRVAYLDRLLRELLIHMPEHGVLISYDYIGPHRHQYRWDVWSRIVELWDELPATMRAELRYPHMATMLATDPMKAVHSELILSTLQRYFDIVEARPLGGVIAFELLLRNVGLFRQRDSLHGAYWINRIIEADVAFTAGKLENSLFGIMICRPKKAALADQEQLARWTREENEREARAQQDGSRYYPRQTIEIIYSRQ